MNKLFFIGVFILSVKVLIAQGPPIFTETPIMLGLEGGGVRTFGKYIAGENTKAYIQPFVVPYNINYKWQIGAVVPFAYNAPNGVNSRFGLSDVAFFTKYQILQVDGKGKTLRSLVKLTQRFPTGNTKEEPALGSGAYQTMLSWVTGFITLKYGIYAELGYNVTSNGMPDNFIYNFAFGFPLLPQRFPPKQLNVYLEFTGNYIIDKQSNNFFFAPGLQWIAGKRFLLETGVQLPLIEDVPDDQKINFMYTLGTRILIF